MIQIVFVICQFAGSGIAACAAYFYTTRKYKGSDLCKSDIHIKGLECAANSVLIYNVVALLVIAIIIQVFQLCQYMI